MNLKLSAPVLGCQICQAQKQIPQIQQSYSDTVGQTIQVRTYPCETAGLHVVAATVSQLLLKSFTAKQITTERHQTTLSTTACRSFDHLSQIKESRRNVSQSSRLIQLQINSRQLRDVQKSIVPCIAKWFPLSLSKIRPSSLRN